MSDVIQIRRATQRDASKIHQIGRSHSRAFGVSTKIKFYQKPELAEWASNRRDILLVAESGTKIIGFIFCKVMSLRWALIDGIYVLSKYRKGGTGSLLLKECLRLTAKRGINYVSSLVDARSGSLKKYFQKNGFQERSQYLWLDKEQYLASKKYQ